jgi:hypothetical protein
MSNPTSAAGAAPTTVAVPRLSVRAVLPWLLFAALLFVVALYFISAEQGAAALIGGNAVHEWTHDGRHLLGFPCH